MILLKYGKQESSQFSIKKYFIASWTNTGRCLKTNRTKIHQKAHACWVARNPPESLLFFISYNTMLCKANFSPLRWAHLLPKPMYSTYCKLSFAYSNNNYCCSWWNKPHQAKGCTLASSRRHITTSSFKTDAQHFITRGKCAAIKHKKY